MRDIPKLCKSCKYSIMIGHGVRCRKKTHIRYRMGEIICARYRKAKRFVEPAEAKDSSGALRPT